MKVGFDSRPAKWYRGTGIGTYTYQLINWFNKIDKENQYTLFIPDDWDFNFAFKKNFTYENIKGNANDSFWDQVNIPNIIDDKKLSIYHVPQNGVGLPKEKNCPFIITLHDVIPYRMPQTCSERLVSIFNEELPRIIAECDAIITVSEFSKRDITRTLNFPAEKTFVTHLAAEDFYRPKGKSKSRAYIKRIYGIDGDFILYIGGYSPRKNIIGLIEAFSKVVHLYNRDVKLVIGGTKGRSYDRYKQRTIDLKIENKVIFTGFIPLRDMPIMYTAAKLFAYPSFYEGFGLPPIEAMACGTPVIASNLTSIPEIVEDAALLMDPYDVDELCSAMLLVLIDRKVRKELIIQGLKKAKSLSWKATAEKTIDIYKKITDIKLPPKELLECSTNLFLPSRRKKSK